MVRKYAQDAHKNYANHLERAQTTITENPNDFTGDRFAEFYAARELYLHYSEPLTLDAVGNTAYNDGKVIDRIRDARASALRWLLSNKIDGGGIHTATQRITENAVRQFLRETAFIDEEDNEQ